MNLHASCTPVKVMLGDSTVVEQQTFDPGSVWNYFARVTDSLEGWQVRPITTTNSEDLRRIFVKFEVRVGNYVLAGHISLQFHVLLYYRPDARVVGAQKELASLMDVTRDKESRIASESNMFILDKLKKLGYDKLDDGKLFEMLFDNDTMRDSMLSEMQNEQTPSSVDDARKQELFDELDGLLVETYQTSAVLVDDARLVTGEEGYLCTFDLEFVKGRTREGNFDFQRISDATRQQIISRLREFENAL